MGSPLALSAFVLRDVFKYLLPTLIALALFAPLVHANVELTNLVFPAIALGYVMTPVAGRLFRMVPYQKQERAELKREFDRGCERWDYDAVYFAMSKDERDSTQQSDAYATFYFLMAGYFLAFAAANVVVLASDGLREHALWGSVPLRVLLQAETSMIDGLRGPSLLLAVVSAVFARQAARDALLLERSLHLHEYEAYARKYQRQGAPVARAIWGRVTAPTVLRKDASVELVAADGARACGVSVRLVTTIDGDGNFLFGDGYRRLRGKQAALKFPEYGVVLPIELASNVVPEFAVELP